MTQDKSAAMILVAVFIVCMTAIGIAFLIILSNSRIDQQRIRACDAIQNEVTRTSCINGWHGP